MLNSIGHQKGQDAMQKNSAHACGRVRRKHLGASRRPRRRCKSDWMMEVWGVDRVDVRLR
jgi:hypothetical protein